MEGSSIKTKTQLVTNSHFKCTSPTWSLLGQLSGEIRPLNFSLSLALYSAFGRVVTRQLKVQMKKKNINWVTGSLRALGKFIVLFPSIFVLIVALFHLLLGTCLRGWLQPICSVQTLFHPQLYSCLLCLLLGPDFKSGLQRPISAPTASLIVVS